jgi:uridine kinase
MTNELIVLKPEYLNLGNSIYQYLSEKIELHRSKHVIAIAGESGSGKSVTAKSIQAFLDKNGIISVVLSMDNYFHLPPKQNHESRVSNIHQVGTQEVNLALLQSHINVYKEGIENIEIPQTNYENDTIEYTLIPFNEIDVLLIEGTYVFDLENIDYLIFMEHTYKDTYLQRKQRNRDEMSSFIEEVLEIEHKIIREGKSKADILIDTHYNPIRQK